MIAEAIIHDAWIFGCCVLLGFAFSFLYDQFLLRRRLIPLNTLFDLLEDIIYTFLLFFVCFLGVTYGNNGILRLYMLLAMSTGCFLYISTVGRLYKRLICCFLNAVMLPILTVKKRLTIQVLQFTMKLRERIKRRGKIYAKAKKKNKA